MPVLIALGVVALALIYWALAFCARESGPAGKALAAGLGVAITGLAAWSTPSRGADARGR
jgi:hypothetical protein